MSSARHRARLEAIFGATDQGKTVLMKLEALRARPARLMVWDPMRQFAGFGLVTESMREILATLLTERRFAVVYQPPSASMHRKALRRAFDHFCRLAVHTGGLRLVVDELADLTEPGWAPPWWEVVTRQGRHARLEIQAASQRPAEVDKSLYGNATRIVAFRLNADGDLDRVARVMRCPVAELAALAPLEFMERDMSSGAVSKKKIAPRELAKLPT